MTEKQLFSADRSDSFPGDGNECRRHLSELQENIDFLIHEIRTPLTAIISSAELAMERSVPRQERQALLDIIHQETLRVNGLLDNFHQAHHRQIESWLSEMAFSTIRVADLLHDAAIRFRNVASRHPIRVSHALKLPPVRGDRMKLDLVLRNLIANAIKYSPDGGTIRLSAEKDGDGVVLCVRDEGIGIPAADLAWIFDRNFRIDNPGSRKTRGSGQGLAIVERIVKNHGGTLRVESEVGAGSAFFVVLPKAS